MIKKHGNLSHALFKIPNICYNSVTKFDRYKTIFLIIKSVRWRVKLSFQRQLNLSYLYFFKIKTLL